MTGCAWHERCLQSLPAGLLRTPGECSAADEPIAISVAKEASGVQDSGPQMSDDETNGGLISVS